MKGIVIQIGTQQEVYHHPVNKFVANFIDEDNFLQGPCPKKGKGTVVTAEGTVNVVEASAPAGICRRFSDGCPKAIFRPGAQGDIITENK